MRIVDAGGALSGKVEKLLDPAKPGRRKCDECSDERKGQPILGLTILEGVQARGPTSRTGTAARSSTRTTARPTACGSRPRTAAASSRCAATSGPFWRNQTWLRVE